MRPHRLFHHPTGVFPFAARWYLAALAIIALLLATAHFVIHLQAQQQARLLMRQWLGKVHVEAGAIRYHLLRNAMVLGDVRMQRGKDSLIIERMLVRADTRSLMSSRPHIREAILSGLRASIHGMEGLPWRKDAALFPILAGIESLRLMNGRLLWYPAGGTEAMVFDRVRMRKTASDGRLDVRGELADGAFQATLVLDRRGHPQLRGKVQWRDVTADTVMRAFAWRGLPGRLAGEADFRLGADGKGGMHCRARIQLIDEAPRGRGALFLDGERKQGVWVWDIRASDWPLSPWAAIAPNVRGMRLQRAFWQGEMHAVKDQDGWHGESAEGVLREAAWRIGADELGSLDAPGLSYQQLVWDTKKRAIRVHKVVLRQPFWRLREGIFAGEPRFGGWRIGIDRFDIEDGAITLDLRRGRITLPSLRGQGNIDEEQKLSVEAESVAPAKGQAALGAHWTIQGEMNLRPGHQRADQWRIHAEDAPLRRLRPLLPIAGSLSLEGAAELDISAVPGEKGWLAEGRLEAVDLKLRHGVDALQARQAVIAFGPVGAGLAYQTMRRFILRDWRYITPLKPLTPKPAANPQDAASHRATPFWWAGLLAEGGWRMDALELSSGRISVGHEDRYWVENLSVRSQGIQTGVSSELIAQGNVGGGELNVRGRWRPLDAEPIERLRVELRDANPFFLHDWLQASGMPRLLRGRLSYRLKLERRRNHPGVVAAHHLELHRGLVEASLAPDDPLLERLGHGLADALERVADEQGKAALDFTVTSESSADALSLDRAGEAMLKAWREAMTGVPVYRPEAEELLYETRIRLHDGNALSHNERARLRRMWRKMKAIRNGWIDLQPVWTGDALDAEKIRRIRFTQNLIESFFRVRGISAGRIFPIWPTLRDRSGNLGFIRVLIRVPRRK